MKIREATENDIPELMRLEKACFSVPWPSEAFLMHIYTGGSLLLVAEAEKSIAGYIGMQSVLDEGYITNVAAAPKLRRRGVATGLVLEMRRRAEEMQLAFLTLEVRESNAAARALYAGHGFRDVGRRKNYYEHPAEDAILMTLYLEMDKLC